MMLVLTRHVGETIRIGEDVYVKVLKVRGDNVSLGFVAPDQVNIVRTELIGKPRKEYVVRR